MRVGCWLLAGGCRGFDSSPRARPRVYNARPGNPGSSVVCFLGSTQWSFTKLVWTIYRRAERTARSPTTAQNPAFQRLDKGQRIRNARPCNPNSLTPQLKTRGCSAASDPASDPAVVSCCAPALLQPCSPGREPRTHAALTHAAPALLSAGQSCIASASALEQRLRAYAQRRAMCRLLDTAIALLTSGASSRGPGLRSPRCPGRQLSAGSAQ